MGEIADKEFYNQIILTFAPLLYGRGAFNLKIAQIPEQIRNSSRYIRRLSGAAP